jgi:hypothetical protein
VVEKYKFLSSVKILIIQVQGYGVQRHFQQYFSYIVAVSFIGEGNQRKPGLKQVTDKLSHNVVPVLSTLHHE